MGEVPVRWSAALPAGSEGTLLALPAGGCLVACREFVGLGRPPGGFRLLVEAETMVHGPPVLLPESRFARAEDGFVVVRDLETGTPYARWRDTAVSGLGSAPDGDLLYVRWNKQDGDALTKAGPDGTIRWRRPLAGRGTTAPLAVERMIITADAASLRAFDMDGRERWVATGAGFAARTPSPAPDDEVLGPLTEIGDGVVAAELQWRTGRGIHLFDLRKQIVRRLEPPIPLHHPSAPVPGRGVTALGPTTVADDGVTTRQAVLIDPSGRVSWAYPLTTEPRSLLATPAGDVLLTASPAIEYWQKYRSWFDLSPECFLRCLDGASGTERWTWWAPLPVVYRPAAGTDTVYAATPDRLWALSSVPEPVPDT